MTQYHFLDDSGDPGLSGAAGSSSYFVLAMVQLVGHNALPAFASVRQSLHLPTLFEFKTYKTTPIQKQHFFRAVEKLPIRIRTVVIDKLTLIPPFTEMNGQELMVEFTAQLTLHASELDLANDVLIVDAGTPAFCRALRLRLSEECRQKNANDRLAKPWAADHRTRMVCNLLIWLLARSGSISCKGKKSITRLWKIRL